MPAVTIVYVMIASLTLLAWFCLASCHDHRVTTPRLDDSEPPCLHHH